MALLKIAPFPERVYFAQKTGWSSKRTFPVDEDFTSPPVWQWQQIFRRLTKINPFIYNSTFLCWSWCGCSDYSQFPCSSKSSPITTHLAFNKINKASSPPKIALGTDSINSIANFNPPPGCLISVTITIIFSIHHLFQRGGGAAWEGPGQIRDAK